MLPRLERGIVRHRVALHMSLCHGHLLRRRGRRKNGAIGSMHIGSDGHAVRADGLLILGGGTGTVIIELDSGAVFLTLAQAMIEVIHRDGVHICLFACEVSVGLFLR